MVKGTSVTNHQLDRRSLIVTAGGALVVAAFARRGEAVDSTISGDSITPPSSGPPNPLVAGDFEELDTCALVPEMTAGPFPLDEQFDRRDITEGSPGHPLRLGLRVTDAECAPTTGAVVEIWHTDATGDYSAFADSGGGKDDAEGTTFLRGSQTAGDDGVVEFQTIYPGWYRGRAVHIHVRVHLDDETVLTSQLFFDDVYTSSVYAVDPYAEFGEPDTLLADDGIARRMDISGVTIDLSPADTANGFGTLGRLNLVVGS